MHYKRVKIIDKNFKKQKNQQKQKQALKNYGMLVICFEF